MSRKLHQTAKATTLCLALPFVHFPATGDVWPLTVVYVSASRRKHGQWMSSSLPAGVEPESMTIGLQDSNQ
ncbi:hypothetical protein F2Q70_00016412 [Brassica cretica]|uniref:Secreted protein n=1 Tax=Brassica cretica TaxID=69181 RepID=A0A8S9HYU8_BRACR|nr:hypothetical protein F2Q70_00016412 [Brassica cretica]